MSTIVLDITRPNAYRVESFNDCETLNITGNLFEAIDDAALTAEAREAVVRIRVHVSGATLEITTYPAALRLKVRALQFALFLLSIITGALDLPPVISDDADPNPKPSTYDPDFTTPLESIKRGHLVATSLRVLPAVLHDGDWAAIQGEVRRALSLHGVYLDGLGAFEPESLGVVWSVSLNDNFAACFVDHPLDLPASLHQIMEDTPKNQHWAAAVELARTIPNLPGDDDANALVFWKRT